MRILILSCVSIFFSLLTSAQYNTVVFDYEKSFFNDGEPLPAESKFLITGNISDNTKLVAIGIYKAGNDDILTEAVWKRPFDNSSNSFYVPVEFKLRSAEKYDVVIKYYQPISFEQKTAIYERLAGSLDNYLQLSVEASNKKIRFNKSPSKIYEDLNAIVEQQLQYYTNFVIFDFDGFSDIVKERLKFIEKANLNRVSTISEDSLANNPAAVRQMEHLTNLIFAELTQYLEQEILYLRDSKVIKDYPTEKLPNVLSVNIGYGGIYLNGDINNLSYGTAPYAGVSFPLANIAHNNGFLSKTSLSLGVFLQNIDQEDKPDLSGPIIGRPIYAGLGYKFLHLFRFNAGAVLLEQPLANGGTLEVGELFVRPYVGLSLDIQLWMGTESKKLR